LHLEGIHSLNVCGCRQITDVALVHFKCLCREESRSRTPPLITSWAYAKGLKYVPFP
jgi:hypothetical protein